MTAKIPNPRVQTAALWLATTPDHEKQRPVMPALRQRFALTALEASLAMAEAALIRARAG